MIIDYLIYSLIPNNYNLRINVTHYNLLNVTVVPFTVQNLSGVIVDAYDSGPVGGAQVVFMNATNCAAGTDSNGFYSAEMMNFTSFVPWINVTHSIYRTNVTPWYGIVGLSGNTHLFGIVVNIRTGAPIENALLEVINDTANEVIYSGTTDSSGRYDFWMTGDFNYTVNVSHQAYVKITSAMREVNSSLEDSELNITLYDQGWGSVTATATDVANDRPIPGAFVKIIGMGGSQGVTDADGQVKLFVTGDVNSEYRINITHPDYDGVEDTNPFSVLEGQDVVKSYQLAGTSVVEGYVRDQYNLELVGSVFVQLLEHGTSNRFGYDNAYFYNTSTDAGGYYRMLIPSSLLNSTNLYDAQFAAPLYETKVMNRDNVGYHGSQQIDACLTGLLQVEGTVVDDYNEEPIEGAYVEISEIGDVFTYNTQTNASGRFMVRIRNNTLGYTVKVAKDGYGQNTTIGSGSTTLYVRLKGSATVLGRIVDKYKDNNVTTISISSAQVSLVVSGSVLYNTTSDGNGDFSMDIPNGVEYYLEIKKSGYYPVNTSQYSAAHDFGNIELTGKAVVSGTVMDAETRKIGSRALSGVNVTVTERTHMRNYLVRTDDNGEYSISIPSDTQYVVAYSLGGYDAIVDNCGGNCTAVEGDNPDDAELTGSTTINGTIFDEYAPSVVLAGATVLFKDSQSGAGLYQLETDSNGDFSINLGVAANYIMEVNRSGYETRTFYGPGGSGYFPEIDILFSGSLIGTISVSAKITDYLSGDPIPAATVKIFDADEELSSTPKYMGSTDVNGNILIRIDGNSRYKYYAHSHGYPKLVLDNSGNGYTESHSFNESLRASFEVEVKDAQNNRPIENASIRAFHFFNQTSFGPYLLNKTIINITANCSGQVVAGINISLNKTSCLDFQETLGLCFFSANTTSGSEMVSFEKVPSGTYDLTIDGSAVGCALVTDTLNVNPYMGGLTSVLDYSGLVDENSLVVHVQNISYAIEGANVTVWNGAVGSAIAVNYSGELLTGLTCSSGGVMFHRMFAGTYTLSVEDNGYDFYESSITINYGANYRNVTLGDTIAPAYSDVGDNSSGSVFQGDFVKIYGYWTDAMELDYAWLETNRSGSWSVEDNFSLSGMAGWTNFTFDTSGLAGQLSWRIRVQDTYGNENVTDEHSFTIVIDSSAPRYSGVGDNSSGNVVDGEGVKIYAYWTDNRELDYARLQTNKTGSWTDESIISLSGYESWSNFTFDTTGLNGTTIGWRIRAYDTTGLENGTLVMSFNVNGYASLIVRVHDPNNNSVSGVGVEVRDSLGSIVQDSGGQDLVGTTDSNGLVAFTGVLPCVGCSVNISKSADVRLTNDADVSIIPRIVADSNDNLHVVWVDNRDGNSQIYYKNYTSADGWSSDVKLTSATGSSVSPDIGIDSNNDLHVVWYDNRDGSDEIYYKNYTSTGGWSSDVRLTDNASASRTPRIAIDSTNNNLHVVWYDNRDGNEEIYYKNCTSAGGWSSDVRLTDDAGTSWHSDIAVDSGGNLSVVWDDNRDGNYEIYYKNYTSGGGWSSDVRLTSAAGDSWHSEIAVDSGGNLSVVWEDNRDGNDEIYYKNHTSASGWSADVRLTNDVGLSENPAVATDSSNDIHIVWYDGRDGNFEVYYKNSTSSSGWSSDVRLTNASDASEYPDLAIDSGDNLHIVWYDWRDGNAEIYYRNYEGYNYIVNSTVFDISWGENRFIEIDPEFPKEPDFGVSGDGSGSEGALFTVFIEDSFGDYVGDGVVVELSGAGYFARAATAGGMVVFDAGGLQDGLEYELYADGSWQGYGVRKMVVSGPFAGGELTVALNTTIMRANITDNKGRPLGGADVVVYEPDDVTVARDATGERLEGVTDSGGFMTFYRLIPGLDYNLSTVKNGVFNSTSFNISPGENKTVDLDPTYYYLNISSGVQNITISVQNSTGGPLEYLAVTLTLYDNQSQQYATNRTDASGVVRFYDVPDGVYIADVNGNDVGYGAQKVILKFGRLTFAMEKTSSDGRRSVVVDGQVGYYIRIEAAGYEIYDSLDDGVIFSGTYCDAVADLNPEQADIKNSFGVEVNGTATIFGIISDKYFNTTSSSRKWLDGAAIKLLVGDEVRYETAAVGSGGGYGNGSYMMRISPFNEGSDLDGPLVNASYDIDVSMTGYMTDKSYANKYSDGENILYDVEMTGEGSVDGSIYDINTSQLITSVENDGPIAVQIYDELHTLMYVNSTTIGNFFLTINPYYSPYYLDLDTNNYELLPQTDSYNGSQSDLELYLYPLTYGYVNFSVKSGNESISGVNIVYYYSGGDLHSLVTDGNGFAREFIRNNTYNLIVNGTHLGYGVNVTTFTVDEGKEKQLDLTLESTVVNVTLLNQNGQGMDGFNVTLEGYSQKATVNGSALFYNVLLGMYNITVDVPDYLAVSDDTINVDSPGQMNTKILTANETRYCINLTNGSAGIANVTVVFGNSSLGDRNGTTDSDGGLLFTEMNPGSYLIGFNETELYLAGYFSPERGGDYANVVAGRDWQTGNNKTIVLNSTGGYGVFRVNTGLSGVNVSLWHNNTDYVEYKMTDSDGVAFLKVNASLYNSSLYVRAQKEGYNDGINGSFNASAGNVTDVSIAMTPVYGNCPEGAITSTCWCGGVLHSSGYCCSGSHQASPCGGGGTSGGSSTTGGSSSGTVVITDDDDVIENISGLSIYAEPYYVLTISNGTGCTDMPIRVSNTGNTVLRNLSIELSGVPTGIEPRFDSLLDVLYAGGTNSVMITMCSAGGIDAGDYGYTVSVFNGDVMEEVSVTLRVVQESDGVDDVAGRLRMRLDRLGSILFDIDVSVLDTQLKEYYDIASESLKEAEDYLDSGDYDSASSSLDEAERYIQLLLEGIEAAAGDEVPDAVNWYVLSAVALVLAFGSVLFYWFFLRKRIGYSKEPVLPWNLPFGVPVRLPAALSSVKVPKVLLKVLGKQDVYYAHSLSRKRYLTDVIEKVLELKCPKCGGKIYQNRCVWCGFKINSFSRAGNDSSSSQVEEGGGSSDHFSKGKVYYTHRSQKTGGAGDRFVADAFENVVEEVCPKCGGKVYKGKCVYCG